MRTKKLLSVVLAFVMVLSLLPVSALAASYSDAEGHWAEAAINRWSDYGIVTGDERGFRPNDNMTRAEAAKVLCELFGLTSTAGAASFTDVPADAWYANYIAKANAAGIMGGVGDNMAAPNGTLTRETFFVMFARGLGLKEQTTTSGVAADGDSWANGYINALTDKGYVKGDGTGVNALANINRASVMSLLDQTITQYVNTSGTTALTADKGIVLVNAKNVTLTGTTNADIVIAKGASNSSVAFSKATVNGAVTVQADNAKVTADKDSKLAATPVVNGTGSTYTDAKGTSVSGGGGGVGGTNSSTLSPEGYESASTVVNSQSQLANVGTVDANTGKTVVSGNLTIGEGLGNGDIALSNMKITGNLIVKGGGANSITLTGVEIDGAIIVAKPETAGTELPHIEVTDAATTVANGVSVQADTNGAILDAPSSNTGVFGSVTTGSKLVVAGNTALSSLEVTAPKSDDSSYVPVVAAESASITAIKVSSGDVVINKDGGGSSIGAVTAANGDGGEVLIETTVASVTASGANTGVVVGSGGTITANTITVTGGNVTIDGDETKVPSTITASAGTVNIATGSTGGSNRKTVAVTGSGVTVNAANGAEIAAVQVAADVSNTTVGVAEGSFGSVDKVEANGTVTVKADVNEVEVKAGSTATVAVADNATVTRVDAKGETTIASSGEQGGIVATLDATADVTISGANATVRAIEVKNTTAATTIKVDAGTVDTIKTSDSTTGTVTVAKSAGATGGSVGNVTAGSAAGAIVADSTVVDTVTAGNNTSSVTVTGDQPIEVNATSKSDLAVIADTASGASAATVTISDTDGTSSATLNGAAATIATKSAAPEDPASNNTKFTSPTAIAVKIDTNNNGGTIKVYKSTSDAEPTWTLDLAAGQTGTFAVALSGNTADTVYASFAESGKTESNKTKISYTKLTAKMATVSVPSWAWSYQWSEDEQALSVDLSGYVSGSPSEWTVSIPADYQSWVTWDSGYKTLRVNRTALRATTPAFDVTVSVKDALNQTASFAVNIGATTAPVSSAPNYVALEGNTNQTLKVGFVTEWNSDGSPKTYDSIPGTFDVYATSASSDTTKLVASTQAAQGNVTTISLTNPPAGNVYVVFTKKFGSSTPTDGTPSARVLSSGYKAIAKKVDALPNFTYTTEGNKSLPSAGDYDVKNGIDFSTLVQYGAGAGKYSYAVSGPSWVAFDKSAATTLKAAIPTTAVTATPVTVTVTDTVSKQSVSWTFTITVAAVSNISAAVDSASFSNNTTLVANINSAGTPTAGDTIRLYETETSTGPIATVTLVADQISSKAVTLDLAADKLNILLKDNVYVAYAAAGKVEGARVKATGFKKLGVTNETATISGTYNTALGSATTIAVKSDAVGIAPYSFSVSPALPAGLTLTQGTSTAANTATISGTPTVAVPATVYTVYIRDAAGAVASEAITITIAKASQSITEATIPSAAGADGYATISGLTTAMEYSVDGGTTYTKATAATAQVYVGIAAKSTLDDNDKLTVKIRLAETATAAAGSEQSGNINMYQPAATPTYTSISATNNPKDVGATESLPTITVNSPTQASNGASGTLSYQWYKSTSATSLGSAITDATSASYGLNATDAATAGVYFYTCVITNTVGTGETAKTATASAQQIITINEAKVTVSGTVAKATALKESNFALSGITVGLYLDDGNGAAKGNAILTTTTSSDAAFTFSSNVPANANYVLVVAADSNGIYKEAVKAVTVATDNVTGQTITLEAATAPVYSIAIGTDVTQAITAPLAGKEAVTKAFAATVSYKLAGETTSVTNPTLAWSVSTTDSKVTMSGSTLSVAAGAVTGNATVAVSYTTPAGDTITDSKVVQIKAADSYTMTVTAAAVVGESEGTKVADGDTLRVAEHEATVVTFKGQLVKGQASDSGHGSVTYTAKYADGASVASAAAQGDNAVIWFDAATGELTIPANVKLTAAQTITVTASQAPVEGATAVTGTMSVIVSTTEAKIGSTEYTTLAQAAEASGSGAIELIGDVTIESALNLGDHTLTIPAKTSLTLDDAEAVVTGKVIVENGGKVQFANYDSGKALLNAAGEITNDFELKPGASIWNHAGGKDYEIVGSDENPTNEYYLQFANGSIFVKDGALVIGDGTTGTVATVKNNFVTFWESNAGAYNVTIAQYSTLNIAGTMCLGNGQKENDSVLTIENGANVDLGGNGKIVLASLTGIETDNTFEITAGQQLYLGENAIIGDSQLSGNSGTALSAGKIKLDFKTKTATFQNGATAKVLGWPSDWAAVIESGATVTLASLGSVANVKKDITVKAGGTLKNDAIFVFSKAADGATTGTVLTEGVVTLNVEDSKVTIGDGTTRTTAKVLGWPDDWAAVIESGATVTLASLGNIANVEAEITVKAGADLNIQDGNAIFFSTNNANATEGTYLATGSVTLSFAEDNGPTATFTTDATGTIYGWPDEWTAVQAVEDGGSRGMQVRDGLDNPFGEDNDDSENEG